ncbi:MAG: ABC transporter ATP-binding protein [Lachnospiraceae bacterium]|jgi:ABC-2 type transport system ATP-binding protein|nr:ABC transporter ATP-binding protein [Lachnospiraceae bacterium]
MSGGAEMNNNYLVEIQNLTKKYADGPVAINNISLAIGRGRIIGLLGPNGSGKTTLIKMMNGLLNPTNGTIAINGAAPGVATKKRVSYLPDKTYLPTNLNVSQIIDYYADFYEDFKKERAYTMLQSLNISLDSRLKTLSKGTQEKVQLILVMSRDADLFILDEPIAGVDPAARDYILKTIITNYNENATILLSTHLITDIENILDEVIFLRHGQVLLTATVEDIRAKKGKSVDAYFREVFAC